MGWLIASLLLASIGVLVYRKRAKKHKQLNSGPDIYLMIYDGSTYRLSPAIVSDGKNYVVDGIEYPASACKFVEMSADEGFRVYVFASEAIALTTHNALMKHRAAVIKGYLFSPGGDWLRMVQMVAAAVVLACALYIWSAFGSINAALSTQNSKIDQVVQWTQKPMVALPQTEK